jgi:flavin reductase (DIM6/NTAB) family NADH-FMN oxidoreductase RutF
MQALFPHQLRASDRYKLLIGGIVPRPIAFVSTLGTHGVSNLAPYSFFAGVGSEPMTLLFCPATRPDGSEKDSLRNAKPESEGGMGEFVVNVVPEAIVRQMAKCAAELPPDQSEFDYAGLTPAPSVVVRPPRVLQSPLSYECRTLHVLRTNAGVPNSGNVVVGEVVCVHAHEGLVSDRLHVELAKLAPVARLGGDWYCTVGERFELGRG